MRNLLRAGGVLLILGSLVLVGRSWSEPKPAHSRARIALVNLAYVMKNCERVKLHQVELKEEVKQYQERTTELQTEIKVLSKKLKSTELAEEERDETERKLQKVTRELAEVSDEARRALSKKNERDIVVIYREVRQTAQRYAKAHDYDMVFHYNDAIEEAELNSPANVARKMQAGACMPLYLAAGVDISKEIVEALNDSEQ